MIANNPLSTYKNRLPWHGFGTDDPNNGLYVYPVEELIKKAIIQHNPKHSIAWLVYDLDSETAWTDWQEEEKPPPNIAIINRENGHAHFLYGLETPIHNYENASDKALRYMAVVDIGLTIALEADPGYNKLISKNPLNERWLTIIPRTDLYTLDELSEWVDLPKYSDRRRKLPEIGLGRNCNLFEDLRRWAYKERRKNQQYLSMEMFCNAVRQQGLIINSKFQQPLPHNEVRATAKSISKWTWKNMSSEGFKQWHKAVSKKGNEAKTKKSMELTKKIKQIKKECPLIKQNDIAAMLGVNKSTISRHLNNN